MKTLTDNFSESLGIEFDSNIGVAYFILTLMVGMVGSNFILWAADYMVGYFCRARVDSVDPVFYTSFHGTGSYFDLSEEEAKGNVVYPPQISLSCVGEFSKGMSCHLIWIYVVMIDRMQTYDPNRLFLVNKVVLNPDTGFAEVKQVVPFATQCGKYASNLYIVGSLACLVLLGMYSYDKANESQPNSHYNETSFQLT